jgi:hypothetical protein
MDGMEENLPCDDGKESLELDGLKFFWRKDNVTLATGRNKFTITSKGKLFIADVTSSDSGQYQCVVMSEDDTFKKVMPAYKLLGWGYNLTTEHLLNSISFK